MRYVPLFMLKRVESFPISIVQVLPFSKVLTEVVCLLICIFC